MRTGEVFALTWNDIDVENNTIRVTKTVYHKRKDNIRKNIISKM